jgi:hypothetical protein
MSKPTGSKPTAKEVRTKVLRRRREEQYKHLLSWTHGDITGVECLEQIERLYTLILLEPDDFKPPKPSIFGRKP